VLLTRTQEGHWDGASWTELGDGAASETAGKRAGLVFSGATLGETLLLRAGLALPVAPTAPQLPVLLSVYARAGATGLLWSGGNPPPALASLSPTGSFLVGSAVLAAEGAQTLELELDVPALHGARTIGYSPDTPWDGQFALHTHAFTADGSDLVLPAGSAEFELILTTRVFTGIEIGGPLSKTASSRPDICPICGEETLRETWIWCALRNRLECPRCGVDPDDIPRRWGPSRDTLVNDKG